MNVEYRAATIQDQQFLNHLLYEAIFVPPGETPPPRRVTTHPDIARYASDFGSQPGDLGSIALKRRRRIGAAWVRLVKGYAYIDDHTPELIIAVLPKFRGQGVGSALLRHLFIAASRQFEQVGLNVDGRNPARRLYQRFGFEDVRHDGNSYVMLKQFCN